MQKQKQQPKLETNKKLQVSMEASFGDDGVCHGEARAKG